MDSSTIPFSALTPRPRLLSLPFETHNPPPTSPSSPPPPLPPPIIPKDPIGKPPADTFIFRSIVRTLHHSLMLLIPASWVYVIGYLTVGIFWGEKSEVWRFWNGVFDRPNPHQPSTWPHIVFLYALAEVGFNLWLLNLIHLNTRSPSAHIGPTWEVMQEVWGLLVHDYQTPEEVERWIRGWALKVKDEDVDWNKPGVHLSEQALAAKERWERGGRRRSSWTGEGVGWRSKLFRWFTGRRWKDIFHEYDLSSSPLPKEYHNSEEEEFLVNSLDEMGTENVIEFCVAQVFHVPMSYFFSPPANETSEQKSLRLMYTERLQILCESMWARLTPEQLGKLQKGYDPRVRFVTQGLEDVRVQTRPLGFYAIIVTIDFLVESSLKVLGFKLKLVDVEGNWEGYVHRMEYWIHEGFASWKGKKTSPATPFSILRNYIISLIRDYMSFSSNDETLSIHSPSGTPENPLPIFLTNGLGGLTFLFPVIASLLIRTGRPMVLLGNRHVAMNLLKSGSVVVRAKDQGYDDGEIEERTEVGRRRRSSTGDSMTVVGDSPPLSPSLPIKPSLPVPLSERVPSAFTYPLTSSRPRVFTRLTPTSFRDSKGVKYEYVQTVPNVEEKCRAVEKIFWLEGFDDGAIGFSHSQGSETLGYIHKQYPELLPYQVLAEPINIEIHHWKLTRNIMYRKPRTGPELAVRFVVREMSLHLHLQRYLYFWSFATFIYKTPSPDPDFVPPREYINPQTSHVIISEYDQIVASRRIKLILERGRVSYTWLKGLDHGGFLITPDALLRVTEVVNERAKVAEMQRYIRKAKQLKMLE